MSLSVQSYLRLIGCIVSSICTGLNLFLIYDMKVWNLHIMLITVMSCYQLIFDSVFYIWGYPFGSVEYNIAMFIGMLGGLSSAIVSNIMILNILFIVVTKKIMAIKHAFTTINIIAIVPSLIVILLFCAGLGKNNSTLVNYSESLYSAFRLISLGINLISYAIILLLTRRLVTQNNSTTISKAGNAIRVLVNRLQWYPIIQVISRTFFSWFEFQYGMNFNTTNASTGLFIGQCLVAIVIPSSAVGYFFVFLLMQPRAFRHMKARLFCQPLPKTSKLPAVLPLQKPKVAKSGVENNDESETSDANDLYNQQTLGNTESQVTRARTFNFDLMSEQEDSELFHFISHESHSEYSDSINLSEFGMRFSDNFYSSYPKQSPAVRAPIVPRNSISSIENSRESHSSISSHSTLEFTNRVSDKLITSESVANSLTIMSPIIRQNNED